ncbi:MAG TPA: SMP-30/gluconolactonase/LRE family protein [Solirubrobacteraceae bacterium]|nr:SMP-30/gluconolactonase/LRE family protein [Solirubrobacteraceae bacterium]
MTLLGDVRVVGSVLRAPHGLLEAPRIGPAGELVFSDVIAGGLWECSPYGEVCELLPKRRGIGGAVPHAQGGWVISGRNVIHLAPGGDQRELLGGEEVCGYNDLGTTPDGRLLAGALRYRPLAGEDARPGQLIVLEPEGPRVLSEEVTWPNGIGCSPDGATVYLSDYAAGAVLAVPLDGGATQEFCSSPRGSVDGLALDVEGGVWVALGQGGAVARFEHDGSLDEIVDLPASFVSSLSFGGADMCEVLITTADNEVEPELGGTLLRARSEVAGLPVAPVAAGGLHAGPPA